MIRIVLTFISQSRVDFVISMMASKFTFIVFILSISYGIAQEVTSTIYLLPGQGADHRLFSKFDFPNHKVVDIKYHIPEKGTKMENYAKELAVQIDTTEKYILIGTSIGGMISSEMYEFLNPEKVIVISSAKNNEELPGRYNFQKKIPIYKLVAPGVARLGAMIMQPIVEPDRKNNKDIFKSMLKDKNKYYMSRSIAMIMEWEKDNHREEIIHIHGDDDSTIPIKNVSCNYTIKGGSHMMTLTRADEINKLLLEILEN